MRGATLPGLAALALAFGAALAPAANAPAKRSAARSVALAVQVVRPDGVVLERGSVTRRNGTGSAGGSFLVGADGALVRVTSATSTVAATRSADTAGARAEASIEAVTLLGGRITASSVRAVATASSHDGAASGGSRADVHDLVIDGAPVAATPNQVIAIPGVGTLTVSETVETIRGRGGRRGFVSALHLRLTRATAGFPRGTEVLVGYADAAAASPVPAPAQAVVVAAAAGVATPPVVAPPSGGSSLGRDLTHVEDPPPGGFRTDPPIDPVRRDELLGTGYVFPVVGGASFSNDFGGPRADTGFHQGIDLFAANGTPLVALHDGTLFNVGWNRLGGNRLWLDDGQGNLFYYAHLSGYAEGAIDGAAVRAGQVIGFMGDSGDAQGTPFHVHLEIHPGGAFAVPPYAYVSSWARTTPGSAAGTSVVPVAPSSAAAPADGVVLSSVSDISSLSGLDSGALAGLGHSTETTLGVAAPDPLVAVAETVLPGFVGIR